MYLSSGLLLIPALAGALGACLAWWARGRWDRFFGIKREDRDYPQARERPPNQTESWRDYWR